MQTRITYHVMADVYRNIDVDDYATYLRLTLAARYPTAQICIHTVQGDGPLPSNRIEANTAQEVEDIIQTMADLWETYRRASAHARRAYMSQNPDDTTPEPDEGYYRPEGQPYANEQEAIDALNRDLDRLLGDDALNAHINKVLGTPEGTDHGFRIIRNETPRHDALTWTTDQPDTTGARHTTYPPPLFMAEELNTPGNPDCHCTNPMQAMFCLEGHMMECHAGMDCATARCSHLARYE